MFVIKKMFVSIAYWLAAGGLYILIRFYGTKDHMDWASGPKAFTFIWLMAGTLLGVAYWITQVVAELRGFRRRSYGFSMLFKTVGMVTAGLLILLITRVYAISQGQIGWNQLVSTFLERLTDKTAIVFFLYLGVASITFAFIQQMTMMVGKRVLLNLLSGKYHHPQDEDRIFMFLDLKSSTSHAERLGHKKFCKLIQECFHDLTDSAIKHQVEIYQYVGDEAIMTWTIDDGIRRANCIRVYFDFQRALERRSQYYLRNYGITPLFKAGVNRGPVMVAEIGDIKRDIAYLSDVLNTAARIQDKCNEFDKHLLVSDSVYKLVGDEDGFTFTPIGRIALRGKKQEVEILSVEERA
jgi:adenylate cyclase